MPIVTTRRSNGPAACDHKSYYNGGVQTVVCDIHDGGGV